MLSLQMKNLSTKIKKQKKNQFLRLLIIIVNKKNIMRLNVLMSLKMLKQKRTLTSSNKRKKKIFEEKNSQVFKNSKQIKNESNFVYKITITNNAEKNYSVKVLLNVVVEINVINQRFVVVSKFHFIDSELFAFYFMNNKKIYCYEIYEIKLTLKNN